MDKVTGLDMQRVRQLLFNFLNSHLMGHRNEIFDSRIFNLSTPPRSLLNDLKQICTWLRIRPFVGKFSSPGCLLQRRNQILVLVNVKIWYGDVYL
jgi:hypothetical protein